MVLSFILCTPVVAKEKPKPIAQEWQIRGIEAALEDDRSGVWQVALDKLSDYDPQSVQSLTKQQTLQRIVALLNDKQQDPYVRISAASAISHFEGEGKQYIPDIVALLNDKQQDPYVRISAALALGSFGEDAKQYVPDIRALLNDKQQAPYVRSDVAVALQKLGEEVDQYISEALATLKDPQQSFDDQMAAASALSRFAGENKQYIPDIVALLNDKQQDPYVLGSAAVALSNFGTEAKQYIPDIVALLNDKQQDPPIRSSAAVALSNFGTEAKQYIPDIAAILNDKQQDPRVRGDAAVALSNFGTEAKQYIPDIAAILDDKQQDPYVLGYAAVALGNFGGDSKRYVPAILTFIQNRPQNFRFRQASSYFRSRAADALGRIVALNFNQIFSIFSPIYEEQVEVDTWRFYAYLLSGGDENVKRLLKWIARPEQEPAQLSHDEGVETLKVFAKAWDASKNFPAIQNDLADKTAIVSRMVNWQPQDLPLLKQHCDNLKASKDTNADSVQAAIDSLETWQWVYNFRTVFLTHLAFWLALIFVYPRSPQIQAIFFWNPWMRNILGMGYVTFLLTWIPFLRYTLLQPFQPSLLADAGLANFTPDLYFADSNVQVDGVVQPISTALPQLKGQVILEGDSGLGKTMFVRHLLKQSRRIAVYLPAPACTEGVIEAIQKKLHGDEIKDTKFLQSLIYSGAIDIYIDGLNEVSADTRAIITQFVANYSRGNILIATQPLEWDAPGTAKIYRLQPLHDGQIKAYLLSRCPPKAAKQQGADYEQACHAFLQTLSDPNAFAPEERKAVCTILSNPMELTLAAWILADDQQPNLFNLRQQQYDLMAADYERMWNRDFPLLPFSEAVYQLRLNDRQALPADQFYKELQCMEDEKYRMVISRQWKDAKGEAQKEWVFRHDKIAEFFIFKTFLGTSDEATKRLRMHMGDPRFRGVYFLLATQLDLDAAHQLREELIHYAADHKDHTVSDTFVQLLRSRKVTPVNQATIKSTASIG